MVVLLSTKVNSGPSRGQGPVAGKTNQMIRGLGLSVLPPNLQGGKRSWRLNQPMAKDLVNYDYELKPP